MSFLNPEEQGRVRIRKAGTEAAAADPAKEAVAKPILPASVVAVLKAKQPPKVQVMQVEDGVFEVHFTCSCGEQYVIRCDSAEKSSAPPTPQ